ncbi:MAG: 16S rRNA (cytidine(1402)-2'-O)-methyltransferase [Leptospiraceae bacterium]|nr:16S rRNA (cytidine(1402)-2'-O)-methyltransferase [Leptospiraceae bacterium]
MKNQTGSLFIVATPIGNLEDITLRAIRILKEVDLILCENAKNSYRLLQHLEIKTPSKTLFAGQENSYKWILDDLREGKNFAYISDAGTPGVSDPGAGLVRFARKEGIFAIPIPGPSALAAILSVSGFQTNPTFFLGFLSEKINRKKLELEEYISKEGLIVFYESVYKIKATLEIIKDIFPGTEVLVGRELTKAHEEIILYKAEEITPENIYPKGEFVVLINNYRKKIAKENASSTDTVYRER